MQMGNIFFSVRMCVGFLMYVFCQPGLDILGMNSHLCMNILPGISTIGCKGNFPRYSTNFLLKSKYSLSVVHVQY